MLATLLRELLPELAEKIRRGWQAREGDDEADVIGVPGFWLEAKTGKQPNVRAALRQATADAKGRGIPVAVIRDDRQEPFVALSLDDFLPLVRMHVRTRGRTPIPREPT